MRGPSPSSQPGLTFSGATFSVMGAPFPARGCFVLSVLVLRATGILFLGLCKQKGVAHVC